MREKLLGRIGRAGLLAAGLVLGGCSGVGDDTVVIGFTGPLSGGAAQYGKNVVKGLRLAVDEINREGGLDIGGKTYRVKLVTLDDRYSPPDAATNAKRLVQQYAAPIIFCPHSGGILAMQEFNTTTPRFLLGAYSSEPAILDATNPLTLMIPPSYSEFFEPYARKMMAEFGDRLGLIPASHVYAKRWTEGFAATWERLGGTVLSNNAVDYNTTTDFTPVVSKTLSENPDVLFVGGPSQPTALVVEAARQQGFEGGFAVMDQAKFEEMDDIVPMEMLNGSIGNLPLAYYPNENAPRFLKKYRRWIDDPEAMPPSEVALNYEAVRVIARAMELAGTVRNVHGIRNRVAVAARTLDIEYKPFDTYGLSRLGQLEGTTYVAYVEDGEYQPILIDVISEE